MRNRIWSNYQNTVFKHYFIEELIKHYHAKERWLNIILALASSSSVGAWAVWNKYSMVWATIIAVSQVLTVVKPYFPFNKYLNELKDKKTLSNSLIVDFEDLWFQYDSENIDLNIASTEIKSLRYKMNEIYNFNEDLDQLDNKKIEKKASTRTTIYFKQYTLN